MASGAFKADPGQVEFTTEGTTSWEVPAGVFSISAVCVGGGAGGGGPMAIQVSIGSVTEGDAFNAGQKAGAGIAAELRRQGVVV